ncbi:hypothetical protein GCM10011349_25650 [Novosphingobium indicum]|uniref:DUF1214 domain-containing protein n=1 Tax=Novosphingobium indicum TaxID=462949 RepID=A0ABQ2JTD2_9SPHN|nr:hypothetical protein [Novosphingobium indicum]GGN52300.1 hypothetical protein GCM10011349_25650 [Novosphingobium indicum]
MTANPLWTEEQAAAEKLALRLIERPDIRAAREQARLGMLADPVADTLDGRLGLDRALDQWVLGLAMREANGDTADPRVVWNISNAPRPWFGHVYGGAAVAVDNPDNFNREIPIDGNGQYEVDIRFAADPPQFSIVAEVEPDHHAGLGRNLGALTLQQLRPHCDAEGRVTVTVGPGEGGATHLRTEPGARIQVYTRDSQSNWRQVPAEVCVRRLDPPAGWRPRTEDEIAGAVVTDLPAWIAFWSGFKNDFLGPHGPNTLVGPNGRDGGWGYLAGGRFALEDGQGVFITIDPAGSYYTGIQITDPWTISPDPMLRMVSLNSAQVAVNADGTVSYVISGIDPGIANWVDTTGLSSGWMLLRWQGVPDGADPALFLREVRLVDLARLDEDIAGAVPRVDIAGRGRQIRERTRQHGLRTAAPTWGED